MSLQRLTARPNVGRQALTVRIVLPLLYVGLDNQASQEARKKEDCEGERGPPPLWKKINSNTRSFRIASNLQ